MHKYELCIYRLLITIMTYFDYVSNYLHRSFKINIIFVKNNSL